ncbi:hypothetical protein BSKO_11182 [Bryopsis sp. KO-2023]|nr:hypothetical protein BSKO_11182 [Bryopsis sp. KO-2023]
MHLKVAACFVLLFAVASAQTEAELTRVPQLCPDLSPPIVCITFPCDPCPKPPTSDICSLPSDSGPCEAAIQRWFFNKKTNQCEEFIYGGCLGNKNNFESRKACEMRCGQPVDICQLPSETGFCKARIERWFFNKKSGSCEKFIWGGCGGNKNNFTTRENCVASCGGPPPPPVDICKLPAVTGPCRAAIPRWFFNSLSGQCERFTYGGCRGNKNNFQTIEECKKACGSTTCSPLGTRCSNQKQCCGGPKTECCSPLGVSPGFDFNGICVQAGKCFLKG